MQVCLYILVLNTTMIIDMSHMTQTIVKQVSQLRERKRLYLVITWEAIR